MSFLQPILLVGLPLALLPVIIHLINRHRHQTVEWAAMLFLLDARKMNKGLAKLRQFLILAMRVLAVGMLIFAASRPLSGGILALTGGTADTVILLLDRSASMEQQILETGESKRSAALAKLSDLLEKTGQTSEIILIDSATLIPTVITDIGALTDLPQTAATSTSADIPDLLQSAADYLATNESGRTDIWLASDQREADWQPGSGRWQSLRSELSSYETVRLFLLSFPEDSLNNFSIAATNVQRQRTSDGMQLVMDLKVKRSAAGNPESSPAIPLEFTINGTRTVQELVLNDLETVRIGHTIPLGNENERGWGKIELPADENRQDNSTFFVFDTPAPRLTTVVTDDPDVSESILAAATASIDGNAVYKGESIATDQTARISWDETALLFWQAELPGSDSPEGLLLQQYVNSGRSLVLLPPTSSKSTNDEANSLLFGFKWTDWLEASQTPLIPGWWRAESGLLANTQSGEPLPVEELKLFRVRRFEGEVQPLLELESGEQAFSRILSDQVETASGALYAWNTLPRADYSSLATDGIAFFVMVHRALEEGVNAVSNARFREASRNAFPEEDTSVTDLASDGAALASPLLAGVYEVTQNRGSSYAVALNRPDSEDISKSLSNEAISSLLAGIDYRHINEELGSNQSLAAEIWRAFLFAMGLALIIEAYLCLPPRDEDERSRLHLSPPNLTR